MRCCPIIQTPAGPAAAAPVGLSAAGRADCRISRTTLPAILAARGPAGGDWIDNRDRLGQGVLALRPAEEEAGRQPRSDRLAGRRRDGLGATMPPPSRCSANCPRPMQAAAKPVAGDIGASRRSRHAGRRFARPRPQPPPRPPNDPPCRLDHRQPPADRADRLARQPAGHSDDRDRRLPHAAQARHGGAVARRGTCRSDPRLVGGAADARCAALFRQAQPRPPPRCGGGCALRRLRGAPGG